MDVLDSNKNEIHEVIKINHYRRFAALVGLKEKLYLFGGIRKTKSLAEMFDKKRNKWETLPNIPSPKEICYATLVGDLIFVFGHGNDLRGSEIFHVLDTNTNKWIDHDFPEMQKGIFFWSQHWKILTSLCQVEQMKIITLWATFSFWTQKRSNGPQWNPQ